MKIATLFLHQPLFCKNSTLTPIDKKRNLKGSSKLQWENLKLRGSQIQGKYVKQATLIDNQKLFLHPNHRICFALLKRIRDIKELKLDLSIMNQDFNEFFKVLRRLKRLTSLQFSNLYSFLDTTKYVPIFRALKYFPKLQKFSRFNIFPSASVSLLKKMFTICKNMPKLTFIDVEIQSNSSFMLRTLPVIYSVLSTIPKLPLKLNLVFSTPWGDFENLFNELSNFWRHQSLIMSRTQTSSSTPSKALLKFLKNNPRLQHLDLEIQLLKEMPLALPFPQLPQLTRLFLSFPNSPGLLTKNFSMLLQRLSESPQITEFGLELSQSHLSDQYILNLCNTLALLNLETLSLILGDREQENISLSALSVECISQMLPKLQTLSSLALKFLSCSYFVDKPVQLLMESICQKLKLRDLRLEFNSLNLTDEAFAEFSQGLKKLESIEIFELNLSGCQDLKGDFIKPLCKAFVLNQERFKKFSFAKFVLQKTNIEKETIKLLLFELGEYARKGNFCFVLSDMKVNSELDKAFPRLIS